MKVFHNDPENYPEFKDAGPTIHFIETIHNLIKAMSSKTPENALLNKSDCTQVKVVFY